MWDVSFEIECENDAEAKKLQTYLENNNLSDDTVSFETGRFYISGEYSVIDTEGNKVLIGDETDSRDIGRDNIHEFVNELDGIAEQAGVTIRNFVLKFYSREENSFEDSENYVFLKKLYPNAFDRFIENELQSNFGEDYATDEDVDESEVAEYEEELRNQFENVPWMIVCGKDELVGYFEENPDCEGMLAGNELGEWFDQAINEWKFPWEEGCTMWAAAVDEDGESMWDNQ